jgi:Lar family restriction alleviation protein
MNEKELKPCPFCGSKKTFMDTGFSGGDDSKLFWIVCEECYSSGPALDKKVSAIAAWNRREIQK